MHDEMGTVRIDIEIENLARSGDRRIVRSALVDTGAELSWIPASTLESLGIKPYKTWRFRQAADLVLLGSRTLEGLNVRIEPLIKQLVDAGPAPAATA